LDVGRLDVQVDVGYWDIGCWMMDVGGWTLVVGLWVSGGTVV
jgi:hypothetical protein